MIDKEAYHLTGGVLFFLINEAALPDGTARDHMNQRKDEHSEPILMTDLVYTFTGSNNYGATKDTSKYKDCLLEGSCNLPFNNIAACTTYHNKVTGNYSDMLDRMDKYVDWHMNPEMKEWFVKCLLEVIENDGDIPENQLFYVRPDGIPISKGEIRTEEKYDLPAFMVGVLHFILTKRREQNYRGEEMLDAISVKKSHKPRRYTGNLGELITRTIDVDFLPSRLSEETVDSQDDVLVIDPDVVDDETDDEVIRKSIIEKGTVMAEAVAARLAPYQPNEGQEDNLVAGFSTLAAAMEAQKHVMAEEIRKHKKEEDSTSGRETHDEKTEQNAQGESKTTIIHQQTNVIQNGENNMNMTNNGTINFNF